jgi:hypothetical protein
MYAKYIVLFCLLGLSALLPAQAADHNRINIRIFPSQVLSITTAKDSKNNNNPKASNQESHKNELIASNLYGYQIKLIDEKQSPQTNIIQTRQMEKTDDCLFNSKLIYSKTSSAIEQKIPTSHLSPIQRENLNKCLISKADRTLVYLIITQ